MAPTGQKPAASPPGFGRGFVEVRTDVSLDPPLDFACVGQRSRLEGLDGRDLPPAAPASFDGGAHLAAAVLARVAHELLEPDIQIAGSDPDVLAVLLVLQQVNCI